jgi:hypothetical protein
VNIFVDVTMAAIKKKLFEEDHERAVQGEGNDVTANDFIITGLDLEEQQYVPPNSFS